MAPHSDTGNGKDNRISALVGTASLREILDSREKAARPPEPLRENIPSSHLAEFVLHNFRLALEHRDRFHTDNLLDCQRRIDGKYSADKLADINAQGGSTTYFNLTASKCAAAEALISEIFTSSTKPWTLRASPIPSLPDDVNLQIRREVLAAFAQDESLVPVQETVSNMLNDVYDAYIAKASEEAKTRVGRLEKKLDDVLDEGGWTTALSDFLHDLCVHPYAVLKGPTIRAHRRINWKDSEPVVEYDHIPTFSSPSPFDIYLAPNATRIEDGFIIESVSYLPDSLAAMKGEEGWNDKAIEEALKDGRTPPSTITPDPLTTQGESERAEAEDRDPLVHQGEPATILKGLEYWGQALETDLVSWGMKIPTPSESGYQDVGMLVIGRHAVWAILNPHPLGEKPYSIMSWRRESRSLVGKGLPQLLITAQDFYTAVWRNLQDNVAFSSGPIVVVDHSVLYQGQDMTKMWPRRIFIFEGDRLQPGRGSIPPISFQQPPLNAEALLLVVVRAEEMADNDSGVPRFTYGGDQARGAGETFGGLALLIENSNKTMQQVVAYVDKDIIRTVLERVRVWIQIFLADDSMEGDAQVVAQGASAALIREQMTVRRQEFLDRTNNPTDLAIIQQEGRAALLREVAATLDMSDDIVPDAQVMRQRAQASIDSQFDEEDLRIDGTADEALARAGIQPAIPAAPAGVV